MMNVFVRECVS